MSRDGHAAVVLFGADEAADGLDEFDAGFGDGDFDEGLPPRCSIQRFWVFDGVVGHGEGEFGDDDLHAGGAGRSSPSAKLSSPKMMLALSSSMAWWCFAGGRLWAIRLVRARAAGVFGQAQGDILHLFARGKQGQSVPMASVGEMSLAAIRRWRRCARRGLWGWRVRVGCRVRLARRNQTGFLGRGGGGFGQPLQSGLAQDQAEAAQGLQGGGGQHCACRACHRLLARWDALLMGLALKCSRFCRRRGGLSISPAVLRPRGDGGSKSHVAVICSIRAREYAEFGTQAVDLRAVLVFVAAGGGQGVVEAVDVFVEAAGGDGGVGNGGFEAFGIFAVFP